MYLQSQCQYTPHSICYSIFPLDIVVGHSAHWFYAGSSSKSHFPTDFPSYLFTAHSQLPRFHHSFARAKYSGQLTYQHAGFSKMERNHSIHRKPTQSQGLHTNFTQIAPEAMLEPSHWSYEAAALLRVPMYCPTSPSKHKQCPYWYITLIWTLKNRGSSGPFCSLCLIVIP